MRVVRKSIEVLAWFTESGEPNPIRFRIKGEDETFVVVRIGRIIKKDLNKIAGNKMITFTCSSVLNRAEKIYEVRYEIDTCKWLLYKM